MSLLTIYPRLFTTRRAGEGTGLLNSRGDATVQMLYQQYITQSVNTTTWSYRKLVLDCALRLFGDFGQWVKDQRNNPRLAGYNLQFVVDTVNFIMGEDRMMSVETWMELVSDVSGHAPEPTHLTSPTLAIAHGMTTEEVLQKWCAARDPSKEQRNGFEDLLLSLYILFGEAKTTLG